MINKSPLCCHLNFLQSYFRIVGRSKPDGLSCLLDVQLLQLVTNGISLFQVVHSLNFLLFLFFLLNLLTTYFPISIPLSVVV